MNCPHCQTALPDPTPRFCDACGMSTGARVAPRAAAAKAPAADEVRCPECGLAAKASRCKGCGARVRWPEGVEPPGEER